MRSRVPAPSEPVQSSRAALVQCRARAASVRKFSLPARGRPYQARPTFQLGDKNLIPVVPGCEFNRPVVRLVLLMNFERLAKSHEVAGDRAARSAPHFFSILDEH